MFTIHQVRLGLATNSSSSHSLIILPDGASDDQAHGDFGWSWFTAGSAESKSKYAALQLRSAMSRIASADVAQAVTENWTGVKLADPETYSEYIDHQSQWVLPLDWAGRSVDRAFFNDLRTFLLREDVVVLGGNDNDDVAHPLAAKGKPYRIALGREGSSAGLVCRKDRDYWVLFNRHDGTKIRMSFDFDGKAVEPTKALLPELVDVKITDYCLSGCKFCYQDSTPQGKHADKAFLSRLALALSDMRVFEVAIGGGEPTLHPDFVEILQRFRQQGVVPNFTTKNLAWLNDHGLRQRVLAQAGAFAYSVEKATALEKLAALRDVYEISGEQIGCQYVMGTTGMAEFERILRTAAHHHMRITLLGYKANGRGEQFKPVDYTKWTAVLRMVNHENKGYLKVGIDTALADEFQSQLADLGVPRWCYEVVEGKFSMYIDAVAHKTAKSSYGPSLTMRPLESTSLSSWGRLEDEITEHFSRY